MFKRKLQALEYERWATFDQKETKEFRTLVVFLEEQKIRHYDKDKRDALRKIDAQSWNQTFVQYLKDLSCPRAYKAGMNADEMAVVLDWLLAHAVAAEYTDHAALFNQVKPSDASAGAKLPILDCSSDEFQAAVNALATALALPAQKDVDSAAVLGVVAKRLENRLARKAPAKRAGAGAGAGVGAGSAAGSKSEDQRAADAAAELRTALGELEAIPLGFTTGDKSVDKAATVLRLLYIQNLRELQTLVNEVLVVVQEFTANPQTDSRLGQVGR